MTNSNAIKAVGLNISGRTFQNKASLQKVAGVSKSFDPVLYIVTEDLLLDRVLQCKLCVVDLVDSLYPGTQTMCFS